MNKEEILFESVTKWMNVTTHIFMHKMNSYAKNSNLSFPQMNCLFRIKKHGPIQVKDVSKIFGISNPASSQLLEKLVQLGFIERTESEQDRRVKFHGLTKQGSDLVNGFFQSINDLKKELIGSLDKNEYENYSSVLNTITEKFQKVSLENDIKFKERECQN